MIGVPVSAGKGDALVKRAPAREPRSSTGTSRQRRASATARTVGAQTSTRRPPHASSRPSAVRVRTLALVTRMRFNDPLPRFAEPSLTPSPKYRSLARVLESDAQFADWTARRRQEVALTQLLCRHLPRPLAERVRVTDCRDGVLELAANSGAIAATLRQRAPELRMALARDGVDFNEIRVRVQVSAIAGTRDKRQVWVRLTPAGRATLRKLALAHRAELERSGPELADALNSVLRHARGELAS